MLKASTGPRLSPQHQEKDVGNCPSPYFTNIPGPTMCWASLTLWAEDEWIQLKEKSGSTSAALRSRCY